MLSHRMDTNRNINSSQLLDNFLQITVNIARLRCVTQGVNELYVSKLANTRSVGCLA